MYKYTLKGRIPSDIGVFFKSERKQKNRPQTVKINYTTCSDDKVKCNMFNAHFHSSFSVCHGTDEIFPHYHKLFDVTFSIQEVYTLLSRLDVNKAYGSDNISPDILK